MTIKLSGFAELERALRDELPKATAKAVLRRTALAAMRPIEETARALAPREDGGLAESITTKAVRAQRISRTKFAAADGVTVATGPTSRKPSGPGGNAAWQEFGTVKMPANPYMRPAFDGQQFATIERVRAGLRAAIEKARVRIARRAAKLVLRG